MLVLGCALAACEGESRVRIDFGDVPPVSVDNLAEVTAEALCRPFEGCCAAWGFPFDRAGCESALEREYADNVALIDSGAAVLDETAARRCIAELEASLASCTLENSFSCRRALVGTTPSGGPCWSGEECEEPADGEALCGDSTCGFLERARFGEPCRDTCNEDLEIGFRIWPAYAQSSCSLASLSDPSARCFRTDDLFCSRSTGRCEHVLEEGASCATGQCAMHLWCEPGTSTCVPRSLRGESCSSNADFTVEPPCADGMTCQGDVCEDYERFATPIFDPSVVCGG